MLSAILSVSQLLAVTFLDPGLKLKISWGLNSPGGDTHVQLFGAAVVRVVLDFTGSLNAVTTTCVLQTSSRVLCVALPSAAVRSLR